MAGTSPEGAGRSNYYYPLAALYHRVCCLACGEYDTPKMVHLTWFTDHEGKTRTVLGGTLGYSGTSKEVARLRRVAALISQNLIKYDEIDKSAIDPGKITTHRQSQVGGERRGRQLFGHCSETWPWLYIAL